MSLVEVKMNPTKAAVFQDPRTTPGALLGRFVTENWPGYLAQPFLNILKWFDSNVKTEEDVRLLRNEFYAREFEKIKKEIRKEKAIRSRSINERSTSATQVQKKKRAYKAPAKTPVNFSNPSATLARIKNELLDPRVKALVSSRTCSDVAEIICGYAGGHSQTLDALFKAHFNGELDKASSLIKDPYEFARPFQETVGVLEVGYLSTKQALKIASTFKNVQYVRIQADSGDLENVATRPDYRVLFEKLNSLAVDFVRENKLIEFISQKPKLTTLICSGSQLTNRGLSCIVSHCENLKMLVLENAMLSNNDVGQLAVLAPKLEVLSVDWHKAPPEYGVKPVSPFKAMGMMPNVRILGTSAEHIGKGVPFFKAFYPNLEELWLHSPEKLYAYLNDEQLEELKNLTNLHTISIFVSNRQESKELKDAEEYRKRLQTALPDVTITFTKWNSDSIPQNEWLKLSI